MKTEADEKLDAAREHVRGAIESLAAIVVSECHGAADFNTSFMGAMRTSLNELLTIRDRLK